MAVQVFCCRVQHQIRAVLDRPLQDRGAERVVDDEEQSMFARECAYLGQIDDGQHRVGRGFRPDHARVWLQRRFQRCCVVEIEEGEIEPGAAPAHAFEQPIGAAVQVVHRNDVTARVEQIEHRARAAEAGAESIALRPAFQIGDAALVGHARRILRAAVLVALVHARTRLHIGRRRVDRHHDRAGRWIGALAGVDCARAEAVLAVVLHGLSAYQ